MYTKGPWSMKNGDIYAPAPDAAIYEQQDRFVAHIPFGEDMSCRHGKDALLICAAPELLEALEGMLEIFVDSDTLSGCEDMETVQYARKIIKKATEVVQ